MKYFYGVQYPPTEQLISPAKTLRGTFDTTYPAALGDIATYATP